MTVTYLRSPLSLNRARCYKVRYIVLLILRTEKFKLVTLSYLQGERLMCQMCSTFWLRSGFSHFMNMDELSFTNNTWYLVTAESRISKQSGVQDV